MPRAVKKAGSRAARPAPKKQPRAAPARKKGPSTPVETPPKPKPPKVSAETRRNAIAEAAEQARARLWGEQGQPLTTVEGVTIAFAQLPGHWHLLTFGLALSGMELSIRATKKKDELAPPAWPVHLLTALIQRAVTGRLAADPNQIVVPSEGVAPGQETDLVGLLFTPDPKAPRLTTPHDEVPIYAVVPVTRDEIRVVREWSPTALIEVLAKVDPLLSVDLERASLLQSPRARMVIEGRVEREGSSLSSVSSEHSTLESGKGGAVTWKIDPETSETLLSLLKGRTGHQRPFAIVSPDARVEVVNADAPSTTLSKDGKTLTLKLSLVGARALRAALHATPRRIQSELLPALTIEVSSS